LKEIGMEIDPQTADLVLLSNERAKREREEQLQLISNIRELLAMAESGQIKAVCYAALDYSGDDFTVGVLRAGTTGLHEMIGLAQILNDLLLERLRD
jgi:hypothetical protein